MAGPESTPSPSSGPSGSGWGPHLEKAAREDGTGSGTPSTAPSGYSPPDAGTTGYPQGYQQDFQQGYAQPGYAQPGYPAYGYPVQPVPPTNGLALSALISGILGWTVLPLIASVVAVVLGHMARGQIRRTGEQGSGMAVAGLVLGYLGIAACVAVAVAIFFFVAFAWSTT